MRYYGDEISIDFAFILVFIHYTNFTYYASSQMILL